MGVWNCYKTEKGWCFTCSRSDEDGEAAQWQVGLRLRSSACCPAQAASMLGCCRVLFGSNFNFNKLVLCDTRDGSVKIACQDKHACLNASGKDRVAQPMHIGYGCGCGVRCKHVPRRKCLSTIFRPSTCGVSRPGLPRQRRHPAVAGGVCKQPGSWSLHS